MYIKSLGIVGISASLLLSGGNSLIAAELKISGAAALAGAIVTPNKAAIEEASGQSLTITVNGDANGLKDLFAGKSDVAMIAAPIAVTEAIVNKATPGALSVAGFEVAPVGSIAIKFIVNPANPVKSLTEAQLKDIFTGKITSWKDVGGADQPILLVVEAPGFGTRANVEAGFLKGDIAATARPMQALVQVARVVAQAPNAIGYGNAASITAAVAVIPGVEVSQTLGYATKGPASDDVKKLIAATTKFGTK
jgi:phosphate transport system substrate-binding protein